MKEQTPEPTALDRQLNRALGQLCKALLGDNNELRVTAVVRIRQLAVPRVIDFVVQRLHNALRSKNVGRRSRAALALQLLGPAAYHIPQ